MHSTEDRMYKIAEHYGALNSNGRVKGFRAHEKGYATIKDIVRGCKLYVRHEIDGELTVNLTVTPTALLKHKETCQKAVTIFKSCLGDKVKQRKWKHSIANDELDQYSFDVTNRDLPEILELVDELKRKLL